MTYGQGALEDWRDTLLEAFGNTLTIDQWTTQVKGKVRQEGETVRAYWYSKVRICALPRRFAITAGDSLPDAGYAERAGGVVDSSGPAVYTGRLLYHH